MKLGMQLGLGPDHIVLDGEPAPPPQSGTAPNFRPISFPAKWLMWTQLPPATPTQFLAHVYCSQMAGWMKTPLGTEVNLGPGHTVLDGVPAPAKGAQQPPSFRLMSIVATVAHLSYC